MRIETISDEGLGNSSYLVEVAESVAVVIDPRRDVEVYLELADRLGLRIVASLETHLHADFVSGSLELAEAIGADVVAAADASVGFAHIGVGPDRKFRYGEATFTPLLTPGHTPEHLSFVMERGDGIALFSGGSIIAGSAARTDLIAPSATEELTRAQFHSFRRLAQLPDETLLLPTHGAGSFCSAGAPSRAVSTLGAERTSNPLLQIEDEDRFVAELMSGYEPYPTYFAYLRAVNRHPVPRRLLTPPRMIAPRDAYDLQRDGIALIDARSVREWSERHVSGSVLISMRPQFGSWLGWVIPFGSKVMVVCHDQDREEALRQAQLIGYDRVVGFVAGGLEAWAAAGLPVGRAPLARPEDVEELAGRPDAAIVDVRQASELKDEGRVRGAVHIDMDALIGGRTPDARRAITYCAAGERSATATSILRARGIDARSLDGGFAAWREAGKPTET